MERAAAIGINSSNFCKLIFVTDQGANLIAALQDHERYNCVIHCINLVLKHAFDRNEFPDLEPLHNLIANASTIVKYMKKSGKIDDLPHQLIAAGPTRFNTNYYMLASIQQNFEQLDTMLNISNPSSNNGSTEPEKRKSFFVDKHLIDQLIPFLERFNYAIKSLQFDKIPTFGEVPLWVTKFFPKLFIPTEDDSNQMKMLKAECSKLFRIKVNICKEHKFACALNPDFRSLDFLREEEREGVHSLLGDKMLSIDIENQNNALPTPSTSSAFDEFKTRTEVDAETEFKIYILTAKLKPAQSVLEWWKENEHIYPRLSKIAKKLLAIPCSNTASERIFSSAGFTLNEKRTGLSPYVVDKLMFLKSNLNNN